MLTGRSVAAGVTSLILLLSLACGSGPDSSPAPASGATLTAEPNPVPAGPGWGTTTVKWNTGSPASGQIYLFVEGQPETLFSAGPSGSMAAPWISVGPVYEFRLYAGKEKKDVLAMVKVTRATS